MPSEQKPPTEQEVREKITEILLSALSQEYRLGVKGSRYPQMMPVRYGPDGIAIDMHAAGGLVGSFSVAVSVRSHETLIRGWRIGECGLCGSTGTCVQCKGLDPDCHGCGGAHRCIDCCGEGAVMQVVDEQPASRVVDHAPHEDADPLRGKVCPNVAEPECDINPVGGAELCPPCSDAVITLDPEVWVKTAWIEETPQFDWIDGQWGPELIGGPHQGFSYKHTPIPGDVAITPAGDEYEVLKGLTAINPSEVWIRSVADPTRELKFQVAPADPVKFRRKPFTSAPSPTTGSTADHG